MGREAIKGLCERRSREAVQKMRKKEKQSKQLKVKPSRIGEALKRKRKEEGSVQQYSEREKRRISVQAIRMGN